MSAQRPHLAHVPDGAKLHGYSQSWAQSQGHSSFDNDVERIPSQTVLVERDVRVAY